MTYRQQPLWDLTILARETIDETVDDVKVSMYTQGYMLIKQGDDTIWINSDQVDQLRTLMKEFL